MGRVRTLGETLSLRRTKRLPLNFLSSIRYESLKVHEADQEHVVAGTFGNLQTRRHSGRPEWHADVGKRRQAPHALFLQGSMTRTRTCR